MEATEPVDAIPQTVPTETFVRGDGTAGAPPPSNPEPVPILPPSRVPRATWLLRVIGALALIGSASTFLVQRWEEGNDVARYLSLLLHTGILSAAGFWCGVRIKESKGARTLLGLTLAVIPVHFAVLGGLVYSQLALDDFLHQVPTYVTWVAPSGGVALLTAAGAACVLAPLALLSFLSLARSEARWLTAAFLALNATLLVPLRGPNFVGVLVAALVVALSWLELRVVRDRSALRTLEGRLARAMLGIPLFIIVGRSLQLYELSTFFFGSICASATFVGFALVGPLIPHPTGRRSVEVLSSLMAGLSWACFTAWGFDVLDLEPTVLILGFFLPYAGILAALSYVASGWNRGYRRAALAVAVGGIALDLIVFTSVVTSALCLTAGAVLAAFGHLTRRPLVLVVGLVGAAFGLGYHVLSAIEVYSIGRWGSLALLGVGIILAASYLERHHRRILPASWTGAEPEVRAPEGDRTC